MGTNYYVDDSPRFKTSSAKHRFHIGKNSVGWEFGFRAWSKSSKFGKEIRSWAQWKEHILHIGFVYDEYGNLFDADTFIEKVENTRVPYRHTFTNDMVTPFNHYDYCVIHHPEHISSEHEWKDDEGWSFSSTEFS
jgi:hypothetical protein